MYVCMIAWVCVYLVVVAAVSGVVSSSPVRAHSLAPTREFGSKQGIEFLFLFFYTRRFYGLVWISFAHLERFDANA